MQLRVFGRTGMQLSVLGFGCGAVGGLMVRGDPADQERTVARAIAAGVNYFEVLMRSDRYAITPALPMRPGVEVSGIVEAAGEGIASGMLGTRVAVPMFAFGISSGG